MHHSLLRRNARFVHSSSCVTFELCPGGIGLQPKSVKLHIARVTGGIGISYSNPRTRREPSHLRASRYSQEKKFAQKATYRYYITFPAISAFLTSIRNQSDENLSKITRQTTCILTSLGPIMLYLCNLITSVA